MSVTFSIQFSAAMVIGFSLLLLIAVTAFCVKSGLWDDGDPWGIGWMFTIIIYACFWAVPSLAAWAVWATWLRVVP